MESNMPLASESEPRQPTEAEPTAAVPNGEAAPDAASHAVAERHLQVEFPPTSATNAEAATETKAETAPSADSAAMSSDSVVMSVESLEAHAPPKLKRGDIVEGVVAETSPTEILIDLGMKTEGVIVGRELERMDKETLDRLKVGSRVSVYVLNPERDGRAILSLSRAAEEQDWRKAEELRQSGEIFHGKVDGYNKGGLIVRLGRVRGFVPESQVSLERRQRAQGSAPHEKWEAMRGEDIAVKVMEVDRSHNRLILSEREAIPALRELRKERLLNELQLGERRVGRVKSVTDFGAFVDIGGADGLVHLTEISWKHIAHPRNVLQIGQEVEVKVITIDHKGKRIGLSIKRCEEDPWSVVARTYKVGQLVQGKVTKLAKFGAFACLVDNPEVEGLIHISELSQQRVGHPKEVVKEGDVLTLRVIKIEPSEHRLGLSLKKVTSPDYADADYRRAIEPDLADFEIGSLKESERRRADRKRGKRGGRRNKPDFEDEDEY
ncbi:MAG: S1 RNA-binding domain-containing protein [Chloroflexota bacterium]|jgi:small subunit ribosomal protein S1|uniref:30S ribosomal protein S1 n=1 Tax=Candidatus Thermofonsia Clade 1 bacterium TaxID=2364210 RepID=A0A2M8PZR2_9CHLR|nr:MAG: 30S ribosomal protein S1 [Candidatus Thermofonsia Clade 1 bacterium]RMF48939.1 MAG: S1 RNA-binding domain-containing protein [Chloroflexota bacterium]